MRNALRYVLLNARRHAKRRSNVVRIDPASSGRWFDGWKRSAYVLEVDARRRRGVFAIAVPHSWLLQEGWRRAGPRLDPAEVPG